MINWTPISNRYCEGGFSEINHRTENKTEYINDDMMKCITYQDICVYKYRWGSLAVSKFIIKQYIENIFAIEFLIYMKYWLDWIYTKEIEDRYY